MNQRVILKIDTLHLRVPTDKSFGLTPLSISSNHLGCQMIQHNKIEQDQKTECSKRKHFHFLLQA